MNELLEKIIKSIKILKIDNNKITIGCGESYSKKLKFGSNCKLPQRPFVNNKRGKT